MRFSFAVFFVASLASAYTVPKRQTDAPACATTCLTTSDFTPCNSTDTACICLNPKFVDAFNTCTQSTCSADQLEAALAARDAHCKPAGVDPSNPLPACALPCLQTPTPATCTIDDNACLCKDTTFMQNINTCFQTYCTGQDLTTAQTTRAALCRVAGVDVSSTAAAA